MVKHLPWVLSDLTWVVMTEDHNEAVAWSYPGTWVVAEVAQSGDVTPVVHPPRPSSADQLPHPPADHWAADACPEHCRHVTPAPLPAAQWSVSPPGSAWSRCWLHQVVPAAYRPVSEHQSGHPVTGDPSALTHCHQRQPPCRHHSPSCRPGGCCGQSCSCWSGSDWPCSGPGSVSDWLMILVVSCPVYCWSHVCCSDHLKLDCTVRSETIALNQNNKLIILYMTLDHLWTHTYCVSTTGSSKKTLYIVGTITGWKWGLF